MHFSWRYSIGILCILLLSGCSVSQKKEELALPPLDEGEEQSEPLIQETKNVSYYGIVQPAGISIYTQGTHRLNLPEGKFVLLESDAVDLNGYVGEDVKVTGATRPTVKGDAIIMRVEDIEWREKEEKEEKELQKEEEMIEVSEVEETEPEPQPVSSSSSSSSTQTPTSSSSEMQARIDDMASEGFGAEEWTQEYCSSHVEFCIPIHRNWWFRSFGVTKSDLWHVEISNASVENLGDGPITLSLVEGEITNNNVIVQSTNTVTGFRSWKNGRHFEVLAPIELQKAVEYIMKNLQSMDEEG